MSATKTWVTEPDEVIPIRMGAEGVAARPSRTMCEVFKSALANFGTHPALKYQAEGIEGPWSTLTWTDYYNESVKFAKTLMSLGFAPHRCVNIIGFNSVEWFVAEMGCILAGGIAAGIYTTNLPEACRYISDHSQAEVVVVEGALQLKKYISIAGQLKHLKAIVVYGNETLAPVPDCPVPVYTWSDFQQLGKDVGDAQVEERMAGQQPGHCCCLIYTSGTTGTPKAVMLSHDNITWTAQTALMHFSFKIGDRSISYLPLSHIAAQILDMYGPMLCGSCVYFAQPDALRGSLGATLKAVRPTLFLGVPRVWEKIYEKMQEVGKKTVGTKKKIATWAKQKGAEHTRMCQYGGGGGEPCGYNVANKVVFTKVKENLGLDQAKGCFSAAAPISTEILEYFGSLDLPIYEVFGQSECTGPHTINDPEGWLIGTCGRPMRGTENKIVADTGELCYRGRHIFMGYMHDPEKTAETIDEEGWLHSGDVATFDDNNRTDMPAPSGFMRITGRIKELIITAGGENVAPVLIENEFKKALPSLSNCMVVGDKRKYLTILLSLKTELNEAEGIPTDKLAGTALETSKAIGSEATTVPEAATCPKWREHIEAARSKVNEEAPSRAQVIQKWALLPMDFSEKGGELTPTLKLKRGPTADKHRDIIDALYKE
ncbi:long chain acyl-CoA synthetase [Tribonema minus]|uniref:Long chain acyl-CoA synthetase n=1 Tax=Tribonema minus TaxID=303371 RepID=A0A835Z6J1_9STRA|nr:long chain acyl-CoA synthetase [Tribonema minus]